MTDLATLASELLPGTQLIGAGAAEGLRSIAWVRVMRGRVPAFDALEPGDLVIAPASALAVVAPGRAELDDLAAGLAAVPVSGVLLPDGDGETARAVAAAGIPVVRVAGTDAAALERSVVGYIVGRGAELERQAALLEAELRRRALDGAGAAGLLAVVAEFLGRALALEDGRGESIAVHVPADAPGAAADAAVRHAAAPRGRGTRRGGSGHAALRVPMPAAHGVAGAIVVLGAAPPSELAAVTLPRVAGLLALELAREEAVRGAADRARRAETMPSAGPPWVVAIARQRQPGGHDEPSAREAREAARRALRLLAPARRMSLRGDADSIEVRAVLAVDPPGGADRDGRSAGAGIADLLGRVVAISRPFDSPADRPAAEAEARATLEAAERLPDLAGNVVLAERLAVYRMLGSLHQLADGPRLAGAVLEPLLAGRPDVRREHLITLRAYLERGGVGEAATALGVHRNTATYRLRRIQALSGWDLADADLRLALLVALRLVQDR